MITSAQVVVIKQGEIAPFEGALLPEDRFRKAVVDRQRSYTVACSSDFKTPIIAFLTGLVIGGFVIHKSSQ